MAESGQEEKYKTLGPPDIFEVPEIPKGHLTVPTGPLAAGQLAWLQELGFCKGLLFLNTKEP